MTGTRRMIAIIRQISKVVTYQIKLPVNYPISQNLITPITASIVQSFLLPSPWVPWLAGHAQVVIKLKGVGIHQI